MFSALPQVTLIYLDHILFLDIVMHQKLPSLLNKQKFLQKLNKQKHFPEFYLIYFLSIASIYHHKKLFLLY